MTNTEKTYRCCWYTLLAGTVCMVMLALSMCSCTTTQYVPVIEHKTDTVPAPYPVIKEVPRQRSTTEKALAGLGMLTLLGGIIWIAWKLKRFLP